MTIGEKLVLDHPPHSPIRTPLPPWAVEYPYLDGFIHPWTSNGRLRKGLTLTGSRSATCSATSERTRSKGALRCLASAGNRLYDPCFRQRETGSVAACAESPGDTKFTRVLISR